MKNSVDFDSVLADLGSEAPVTAQESVARTLHRLIQNGALPGGSPLRQEDLAKRLGVSRMPLREAMLKLEAEGLVETQPRRGVVVSIKSQVRQMRQSKFFFLHS
jgi:DNA-binding GntR family transcriptional regulator